MSEIIATTAAAYNNDLDKVKKERNRLVIATAAAYNNDLDKVKKELNRLSTAKNRITLLYKAGRITANNYNTQLLAITKEMEHMKEVRALLKGPSKTVSSYTEEDIEALSCEETRRAINAIRSAKSINKWSAKSKQDEQGLFIPGTSEEYINACHIEELLLKHYELVNPAMRGTIKKEKIRWLIDDIKHSDTEYTASQILGKFEELLKGGEAN